MKYAEVEKKQQVSSIKASCPLHVESKHVLSECQSFLAMPGDERWKMVKDSRLCFNCLNANHFTKDCKITRAAIKVIGRTTTAA